MSKPPRPPRSSAGGGAAGQGGGGSEAQYDQQVAHDSDLVDTRGFCKHSLTLLRAIPRQRVGGRSLSAAVLSFGGEEGVAAAAPVVTRDISRPPPDPMGKPSKNDTFGRNCWSVFSGRAVLVIDRSATAPAASSSHNNSSSSNSAAGFHQSQSQAPNKTLMIPTDEIADAVSELFEGFLPSDLDAACSHEEVRPVSMATWAQFKGVCWGVLQISLSKLGQHIRVKEYQASKPKGSVVLTPLAGSQLAVASVAASMGASKAEAAVAAAMLKHQGSANNNNGLMAASEASFTSIGSHRSSSSTKELPTLSMPGADKTAICELAKKELRRKRATKNYKFYGVERPSYAMDTAKMLVNDVCDPGERYHSKWRSVLQQRRVREEASIDRANKQSLSAAISSTVRSCEKIAYAQVRQAATQSELDAKLGNYYNRRLQQLQTKQSIAQWREEDAMAKAEGVREVKEAVPRTRDYLDLLHKSNALYYVKPLSSNAFAADPHFNDDASSVFGGASIASGDVHGYSNQPALYKKDGSQIFTWSQNSTYIVDMPEDLKKSLSREINGASVLDGERVNEYVRDTVAERLRGMARERKEKIALAAIDCPVSLNLIDGSDYFEEAPTRPGDDSKGPSRHRNAFPANRF